MLPLYVHNVFLWFFPFVSVSLPFCGTFSTTPYNIGGTFYTISYEWEKSWCFFLVSFTLRLIRWYYLILQGGPYGMKFNSGEGGFPAPYGDGYGARMVCLSAYMEFPPHNSAVVTLWSVLSFFPQLLLINSQSPFCFLFIGYCWQSTSLWCRSNLMGRTWEATHDSSLNLDNYSLICVQWIASNITAQKCWFICVHATSVVVYLNTVLVIFNWHVGFQFCLFYVDRGHGFSMSLIPIQLFLNIFS